jgi:SAM-dependent methyltransferase
MTHDTTTSPAAPADPFGRAIRAIAGRRRPLRAWVDVDDLPWGDPDFSERMLREHLDESHGAASRRPAEIACQVDLLAGWMGDALAPGRHVLDVTCGPGLVARELAGRGLQVTGVDIAPAAIRHARELCAGLPCTFVLSDVQAMELPAAAFDAALYLFGQPTVQRPEALGAVLGRIAAALRPGGRIALEILRAERVDRSASTSWSTSSGGLWGDGEHLVLSERDVDPAADAVVERFHVLDVATGELRVYGLADRIVTVEALAAALDRAAMDVVDVHPGWDGADVESGDQFVVVVAERR